MKKILSLLLLIVGIYGQITARAATSSDTDTVTKSQISIQSVINNYLTALGGKTKLEAVKTLITENTMSLEGIDISMITKKMENKFKSEQSVMGQSIIQLFNGEKGYFEQGGERYDIPDNEIEKLKKGKTMDALAHLAENFTSISQEQIDGKKYNVLHSEKGKIFFDATTGLMYKSVNGESTAIIKSYMTVEGLKFPEIIEAEGDGQKVTILTNKIIINSGVAEADFKI